MFDKIWPWLRKILVIAVGFPLVALGLVMIPLPGPGLPIVVAGLFVLSLEFEWAGRHLAYTRAKLAIAKDRIGQRTARLGESMRSAWRMVCAGCRVGR